jgi:glycosyltransferase involved in cell wall biosynthesis
VSEKWNWLFQKFYEFGNCMEWSAPEKMMRPLVSILVPAYDAEKWLAEALRSAITQTWERKEVIVIDDGSDDRTLSVARSFESDIVRVFTQTHQGAAAARNHAFAKSHGDYIQWLDADDLIDPDKIFLQMEALGDLPHPKTLLSGEWGWFLHQPSRAQFIPSGLWCDLQPAEWLMRKMEQNAFMQTATWLASRELTEAAGPWDTRLLGDDDGEYFCRALMASEGVRFVPGARVYYRRPRSESLSYMGASDRKRDALWLSTKLHVGYLRSMDDSPRAQSACVKYLQNFLLPLHPERPDLVMQAQDLARKLGGHLEIPQFSWKYAWISRFFGWRVARRVQRNLPRIRWSLLRNWDRLLQILSTIVAQNEKPFNGKQQPTTRLKHKINQDFQ